MLFIYDSAGDPVAFREGNYLFDLDGYPLAFLEGPHVHRLDGTYVGELHRDMIVDAYISSPGWTSSPGDPGRVPPPDHPGSRGALDYGYPDVSDKLRD